MHNVAGTLRPALRYFFAAIAVAVVFLSFVPQAKAQDALSFFKNYFVTGDYTVGGVGLRGQGVNGWATGYIYIDAAHNNTVPNDAVVVAAFLYWEAIEATDQPSTMNGYFQGYPIVGVPVTTPNSAEGPNTPPCWSSGGGTGSSNGSKHLRVYRADVAPYMVVNGVYTINTPTMPSEIGFQVMLQDSGSNGAGTPLTEGASLVVVYRSLTAGAFKSVVFYDGGWTMNNAFPYMNQTIQGFYEAQAGTAKITHIVGDGQSNFGENVIVSDGPDTQTIVNPFIGAQGNSWDNPTFTLSVSSGAQGSVTTPLNTFTTQVVPNASSFDCLSWGAVVASTPVVDSDGDGLLDVWENSSGYYDQALNAGGTHDWIALPNAHISQKDLYVQVDYLSNAGNNGELQHSHLPQQDALDKIGAAFAKSKVPLANSNVDPISVHFDVGPNYQNGDAYIVPSANARGGNTLDEDAISCTSGVTQPLCPFDYGTLHIPGIVSWKGSLLYAKDQFFQHGRKDSYHYLLLGHALGLAESNWSTLGGSLVSISVQNHVATITTSSPHLLSSGAIVSIFGAVGDYNLNGTYTITSAASTTFTIYVPNVNVPSTATSVIFGSFPSQTLGIALANGNEQINEPNLVVSSGTPRSMSGFSDLGGGDSLITLGLWQADDLPICSAANSYSSCCIPNPSQPLNTANHQQYCQNQVGSSLVQAGTIMHEMGHTLTLTHGGYDPATNTFGQNCKPNFLSVMNYLFQIHGLPNNTNLNSLLSVDYSEQVFPTLNETNLVEANGVGMGRAMDSNSYLPTYGTRWYGPSSYLDDLLQANGGRYATHYCDGTPVPLPVPAIVKTDGATVASNLVAPVDWNNNGAFNNIVINQDVNYNALNNETNLTGYNDWLNINLQQVGARRNLAAFSADISSANIAGNGAQVVGGGAQVVGGGTDIINGGAQVVGGGAQVVGGGAQVVGGGAQVVGGGVEVDFDIANITVDAPTNLTATLGVKSVTLNWSAPAFGQIRKYYVWRADVTKYPMSPTNKPILLTNGGLSGTPPTTTYLDLTVKTNATYEYFVTAALGSENAANTGNQSGPSVPVFITVK